MKILLVDDDAGALQALMAVLKTIPGHDVRCAASAQKAREHAAALGGCDMLITDVVMEPTDGFTLRDELIALHPQLRTVFVSGYDLTEHADRIGGATLLSKPVDVEALRTAVTDAANHLLAMPAKPQAAPTATATPTATAVRAVAAAQPVAVAAGIPSSAPRPVATPAAAAPTAAVPVARAVTAASPQPTAAALQPTAASPQPTVRAVPVAQPVASGIRAPVAVAAAAPAAPADPLVGVQLGDYRVQQFLGKGVWGSVYLAVQLSVNRPVGLKVLDPATTDEDARSQFLADARAKAAVQHPFIISVFEADERNGLVFYTHEYLDGATLEQLIARGQQLDEKTALHVMKVAGEGLHYMWSRSLAHGPLDAAGLRVGNDGLPRLANLATSAPDDAVTPESEIQTLASLISKLLPAQAQSPGMRALLTRMTGGANAINSWPVVLQAVKALEPKVVPVEAAKIKAADDAAMRAVQSARKAQKRAIIVNIITLVGLIAVVVFIIFKYLLSGQRKLDTQINIPAGSYIVGESGSTADLGGFEIDQFETTIGAYAKFIEFIEQNPDREHEFDHPSGPRHIPHLTNEILTLIKNAAVPGGGGRVFGDDKVNGVPLDLNSPMVMVTWWDAYAYAKWKGRDLPTEEEWEAAARGTKGFKYPWGDAQNLKNFNSNEDYKPLARGDHKPADGYNYWSPVDAFSGDESPFKVRGMAGNVSEWAYRKVQNAREEAVLKGGSFAGPPVTMFDRILSIPNEDCWCIWPQSAKPQGAAPLRPGVADHQFVGDPVTHSTRALFIGFRTVKRK